jgi:DNA-binding NarL/FixJ family response regulator
MPDFKYIAIVDDHAMIRKGLMALINLFPGYKVLFDASDGNDFIAQLKPRHLPDIVLLDIKMPHMDGFATAEWLRTRYPQISVLALSTMDSENAIIKMIKHGAKGYVLKDAEPAELQQAFDAVLKHGYFYNELLTRKVLGSIQQLVKEQSPLQGFIKLTDREMEFIKLACSEQSYQQIAATMCLSERTIDGYREAVFRKLEVGTRVGMVMYAIKNGLVTL